MGKQLESRRVGPAAWEVPQGARLAFSLSSPGPPEARLYAVETAGTRASRAQSRARLEPLRFEAQVREARPGLADHPCRTDREVHAKAPRESRARLALRWAPLTVAYPKGSLLPRTHRVRPTRQ